MTYCIVNGHLVMAQDATIPIQDRGFRLGDGVFETIAVHNGTPYQFAWHMQRLSSGLQVIKIPFDCNQLRGFCQQLLAKNAMTDGLLRIQVTRGIGSQGYLPDPTHLQAGANFVVETAPLPHLPMEPVTLWQSSYRKISRHALPVQYKLCQGLNSTLARMEAQEVQCFDALLLNDNHQLCESSSGNLFWLKDGTLFTPSLECGILEGSTRAAIIRLSPYPVSEVEAPLEALLQSEAVFVTNVVWMALPVNGLLPHETRWDSKAVADSFKELLLKDRKDYSSQQENNLLEAGGNNL